MTAPVKFMEWLAKPEGVIISFLTGVAGVDVVECFCRIMPTNTREQACQSTADSWDDTGQAPILLELSMKTIIAEIVHVTTPAESMVFGRLSDCTPNRVVIAIEVLPRCMYFLTLTVAPERRTKVMPVEMVDRGSHCDEEWPR